MLDAPCKTISSASVRTNRKHKMFHLQSLKMARDNNGTEAFIRNGLFISAKTHEEDSSRFSKLSSKQPET